MTTEATAVHRAPIRLLPPETAARIAAGEVIERPASIVKELIENALDAGAGRIEVAVEGGGSDRIRVRDDGCGIPAEQLADAFERHATSKLRSAEELFQVRSLGFRGEALAAIVAAAEVDCTTRVAGESAAATARFRGGRPAAQGSAAGAPGTSIEVRDLFASLPARRAFLRSPRAEARAVARVLEDHALAYPAVAFRLELDGRAVLASPGDGEARSAWATVYDAESAGALLALDHREPAEGGLLRVSGLAGPPSLHRGNRGALHLVANGRAIVDRALTFAVERAYEGLLPAGRHPLGLLRIELPPELIDVNVHPTKAEVRFRDERAVARAVGAALRAALAGAPAPEAPPIVASTNWPWAAPSDPAASPPSPQASAAALLRSAQPAEPREPAPHAPELPLGERLPALRPLGQVDETFLVAEAPDGLCLVDQHAAHERVLYERVLAQLAAGEAASQPLLQAVVAPLERLAGGARRRRGGDAGRARLGAGADRRRGADRARAAGLAGRRRCRCGAGRAARPHGGGGAALGAGPHGGEPRLPGGDPRRRPRERGAAARAAGRARALRAAADLSARPPDAAAPQPRAAAPLLRALGQAGAARPSSKSSDQARSRSGCAAASDARGLGGGSPRAAARAALCSQCPAALPGGGPPQAAATSSEGCSSGAISASTPAPQATAA